MHPASQCAITGTSARWERLGGLDKAPRVGKIDAGERVMGGLADAGRIEFPVLNRRKGPAVRGPRAQADRSLYRRAMQDALREVANLTIVEAEADDLLVDGGV